MALNLRNLVVNGQTFSSRTGKTSGLPNDRINTMREKIKKGRAMTTLPFQRGDQWIEGYVYPAMVYFVPAVLRMN